LKDQLGNLCRGGGGATAQLGKLCMLPKMAGTGAIAAVEKGIGAV